MKELSDKEIELVAIGAAIGSNCIPCIEHHIPKAIETGLTRKQIKSALKIAKKVKQVPAEKVEKTANQQLK
ncbi:carboxymuconolactone decarboxylase family protein [Methanonatronarchaeum sp. AMET-Sl]|uniref:carboxymuconolactone decarboxylase family protein n=1 Tax=Methanonatronarchaeum sp. AMET-Sl TaxID=3037654 RepID=UPI00244D9A40|nr:carboxymuconolactone decarboxylase family protein [Methanonatronarchaeum sp. AMET-Sl]WGI18095.1 carboxymuconolactone decarboxylase family protein [Methanonatronarchaeum sp. AMET-Sl]